jgi:hypothetical protein
MEGPGMGWQMLYLTRKGPTHGMGFLSSGGNDRKWAVQGKAEFCKVSNMFWAAFKWDKRTYLTAMYGNSLLKIKGVTSRIYVAVLEEH